jgi:hypothetical protein
MAGTPIKRLQFHVSGMIHLQAANNTHSTGSMINNSPCPTSYHIIVRKMKHMILGLRHEPRKAPSQLDLDSKATRANIPLFCCDYRSASRRLDSNRLMEDVDQAAPILDHLF